MAGILLALLVEALLVLLILTLGSSIVPRGSEDGKVSVVRFRAAPEQAEAEVPEESDTREKQPAKQETQKAVEPPRTEPTVTPPEPPKPAAIPRIIPLSPSQVRSADIAVVPKPQAGPPAPARGMMGPVDSGPPQRDSARVSGSGPNGEPLYAASWYREPYEDELAGYLSTASGPGWGLIACRTASDFRVEDCVKVDEYPTGSNIARAVLAAAWQFRVRPPRVGGQPKIGEWVRIRIDYGMRR